MNESSDPAVPSVPLEVAALDCPPDPAVLLGRVESLRADCMRLDREQTPSVLAVQPAARDGARNLMHYLALRRQDLRTLQTQLAELGLSSLGRSESHVLANLNAVARCLRGLAGARNPELQQSEYSPVSIRRGRQLLEGSAERLLGPAPAGRGVRIMVTLPSEAATDGGLVARLIEAGMTVARINSAHDGPDQWRAMCRHVREAARIRGKDCRILFDLAGPKIRTGPLQPGPQVLRLKPSRDIFGRVTRPASVKVSSDRSTPAPSGVITAPAEFIAALKPGDAIGLTDARGKLRTLTVSQKDSPQSCTMTCDQTVYLVSGTKLHGPGGRTDAIGPLASIEQAIVLHPGAMLTLLRTAGTGHEAPQDADGTPCGPALITCTLPEALSGLQVGHPIWFDDGKIGGVVESANASAFHIRITDASAKGDSLRADKGINLPETQISISGLTEQDRDCLPLVAKEVDMVGMSFVQQPADVRTLAAELAALGGESVGIVLKIETREAFDNLPALLLAAMESHGAGVMIARGDLAVEMGYGRLAEVQEEILWMCEAAHVPVIWATQVLETLAKKGQPSRAEVTDAAMAVRAECVMLNKGPFIIETVEFLDGVLRRMQEHQTKKSPMLRALGIATRFGAD